MLNEVHVGMNQLIARTGVVLALATVVCLVAAAPVLAVTSPQLGPETIVWDDFENSTDFQLIQAPDGTASWGPSLGPNLPYQGGYSLWAAGSVGDGWPSGFETYPDGTAGIARLEIPQLAAYYSGSISFQYICPSRGAADGETDFQFVGSTPPASAFRLGDEETWIGYDYDLEQMPSLIAREPVTVQFRFVDGTETGGAVGGSQIGPSIDDFRVAGYMFGPVRSLSTNLAGQDVVLSWSRPKRTPFMGAADEERPVAYRVWRRRVGDPSWTELTSTRLTSASYRDVGLPQGRTWEYAVQACTPGAGSGYGELVTAQQVGPADTTKPEVAITGVGNGVSHPSTVTPAFSATDNLGVASLTATLNGAPFASGASVSANGHYTLVVTARDAAGNTKTETVSFDIDKSLPVITVAGAQNAVTYPGAVTPLFSATHSSGPVGIIARLDGELVVSGAPVSSTGPHTLVVTATSSSGLTSQIQITFTIDTVYPDVEVSGVEDGGLYPQAVTPHLSVGDDLDASVDVTATLDGKPFVSGTTIAEDGLYTLRVEAEDNAGNRTVSTARFTVDQTKPAITFSPELDGAITLGPVAPQYSVDDALDASPLVRATLNGDEFVSGTAVSADGDYTLSVTARDAAGNPSGRTIRFTIDTTKPSIFLSGVSHGSRYGAAVTPTFSASDKNSEPLITATLNGLPFESGTPIVADGRYELTVTATDGVGNVNTRTVSFSIDSVNPVLGIAGVVNGVQYVDSVVPAFWATDAVELAQVTATLNGAPFATGTRVVTPGNYLLVVTARDARGNTSSQAVSFSVRLRVSLGTPVAPKTMKKSKYYTVYGSLKPRHTSGTKPVRIYKYRKVSGKWKSYGYVTAKASNYSTYSRYKASVKLTTKGSWRLRAYAPADGRYLAAWSSKYDYVTVK